MIVTPQSQVLRTGDALRIQCIARGNQPTTVEWQRVGFGRLPSSATDRNGLLEIPQVRITFSHTHCKLQYVLMGACGRVDRALDSSSKRLGFDSHC